MANFTDILKKHRDIVNNTENASTKDIGDFLEKATKIYFNNDDTMKSQYKKTYDYKEFYNSDYLENSEKYRQEDFSSTDQGVDLIAVDNDDNLIGIQCKNYDPERTISRGEIDKFLAEVGTRHSKNYAGAIFIYSGKLSAKVATESEAMSGDDYKCWPVTEFNNCSFDWGKYDKNETIEQKDIPGLRDYQKDAVKQVLTGFETHDRGKLVMACGTGKTFTSFEIMRRQFKKTNGGGYCYS